MTLTTELDQLVSSIRKRYIAAFADHMARADQTLVYTPDFVIFGLMDRNIALEIGRAHV